uniref:Prolyl 4-hydroxylase alpha subunit Fe(2+) 2OG dioxygenase domain-containing protein n=1 Tax=viral metagenome TaxID=1070528 RepID=A0A6C0ARA2_9ZZZZ
MDIDFSNNSYSIIRNGISKELNKFLQIQTELFVNMYCILSQKIPTDFNDDSVQKSFSDYAPPISEPLLLLLQKKVEEIVGKKLEPTYSYLRVYYNGAILKKHTDRESCEYSVTLCVKNNILPWDIWFDTKNGNKNISLNECDFIIYKGMELPHWREKYEDKEQIQIFLHYVEANGPYKQFKLDNRLALMLQK